MEANIEQRFLEYDSEIKEHRKHKPLPRSVNVPKYPATDKGRADFIHDAFKDIPDDGLQIIHNPSHINDFGAINATPRWVEVFMCLVLSPVILGWLVVEGCKYLQKTRFKNVAYLLSISAGMVGLYMAEIWALTSANYRGAAIEAVLSIALISLGIIGLPLKKKL